MMIECPSCATAYHVAAPAIGAGRAVICPRCAARWHVPGRPDADQTAPAVTIAPAAPAGATDGRRPRAAATRPGSGARRGTVAVLAGLCGLVALPVAGAVLRSHGLQPFAPRSVNLTIRDLSGTRPTAEEPAALTVRGTIANPGRSAAALPDLALSVTDASGAEVYRWRAAPPVGTLASGATTSFVLDLPRVPVAGQNVAIRFAAR